MGLREVEKSMANNTLTIEQRLARLEKAVFGSKEGPEVKKSAKGFGGGTGGVRFLIFEGPLQEEEGARGNTISACTARLPLQRTGGA